jgi:hypothetical protein
VHFATPILITISTTGSGTLNGSAFTDAAFTITAIGVTLNVSHPNRGLYLINPIPQL